MQIIHFAKYNNILHEYCHLVVFSYSNISILYVCSIFNPFVFEVKVVYLILYSYRINVDKYNYKDYFNGSFLYGRIQIYLMVFDVFWISKM